MPKQSKKQDLEAMSRELMRDLEILARQFLLRQSSADLSRSETALLRLLADHGPSTMSDVSAEIGLAFSSTTGVVDGLVERKLVERTRPEADRRTVVVALTRSGRKAHDNFLADRTALGVAMLEPLSPAERRKLLALFRKMTMTS
jgi:MarR family transcriptional regulator, organic hydroperoxide resistance regulator